jgi:transposase
VLKLHDEGLSYRLIARNVGLSKNTVMDIVRRGKPTPPHKGGAMLPRLACA